jgi:NADH-quinone oxidoreductase subunit M
MGIVLLGLAAMNEMSLAGAVLQMFSHGIMTGLFFALVGMIYGRTHTRMLDEQGGLAARIPVLAVFFILTGLTSLGLPGLSGFPAELSVFIGAFKAFPVLAVIGMTGIVVTAFYVLRVMQRLLFGAPYLAHETAFRDASAVEITALTMLAVVVIGVGVYPFPFLNTIGSAVASIAARLGGM